MGSQRYLLISNAHKKDLLPLEVQSRVGVCGLFQCNIFFLSIKTNLSWLTTSNKNFLSYKTVSAVVCKLCVFEELSFTERLIII